MVPKPVATSLLSAEYNASVNVLWLAMEHKWTRLAHLMDKHTYRHPFVLEPMFNEQLLDEVSMPNSPSRHPACLPHDANPVAKVLAQAECLPGSHSSSPSVQLCVPCTTHLIQTKSACCTET